MSVYLGLFAIAIVRAPQMCFSLFWNGSALKRTRLGLAVRQIRGRNNRVFSLTEKFPRTGHEKERWGEGERKTAMSHLREHELTPPPPPSSNDTIGDSRARLLRLCLSVICHSPLYAWPERILTLEGTYLPGQFMMRTGAPRGRR